MQADFCTATKYRCKKGKRITCKSGDFFGDFWLPEIDQRDGDAHM
jgi:hypothetical protein